MIISILPPIAVFLGVIGVIHSFYLVYDRLKIEGRFTRAVHQVAAQNKSIAKIQDVSRRLKSGEEVDRQEFAECLKLIEEAVLMLNERERTIIGRALYQPSEIGRLGYTAKLLNNASKSTAMPVSVESEKV